MQTRPSTFNEWADRLYLEQCNYLEIGNSERIVCFFEQITMLIVIIQTLKVNSKR